MRNFILAMVLRSSISMCLEQMLKEYRMSQSISRGIPCYFVFGDVVLKEIAAARPADLKALYELKGMGPERLNLYGNDILKIVSESNRKVSRFFCCNKPHEKRYFRKRCPLAKDPPVSRIFEPTKVTDECDVYVLELSEGKVYVGKSKDKKRRLIQHNSGCGSAFTKVYNPTGKQLPRLGNVCGSGDAAERDETLRYMFLRGIENVRGWKYTQVHLSDAEMGDAESNIRELFDLCRRCGHPGHFIKQCKYSFDRLGKKI